MKKLLSFTLALAALLTLTACAPKPEETELHIFAAASMTETMDQVIELYKDKVPDVAVIPTYDSSGTLLAQIQEGADCDIFLSAACKQMLTLEEAGSLLEGTRLNLLKNEVTLAVPEGNPKHVETFDQLAELLKSGSVLLAVGNSDVPVGQYTQDIFDFYGLHEASLAASGVLTYGSNAKEVTTQIFEGTVDCGVIYATDAFSAGLTVVDKAGEKIPGDVVYPAAVLKNTAHPEEAKAFLDFLSTAEARAVFESAGFTSLPH